MQNIYINDVIQNRLLTPIFYWLVSQWHNKSPIFLLWRGRRSKQQWCETSWGSPRENFKSRVPEMRFEAFWGWNFAEFVLILNVLGHLNGVVRLTSTFHHVGSMDVFWNDPLFGHAAEEFSKKRTEQWNNSDYWIVTGRQLCWKLKYPQLSIPNSYNKITLQQFHMIYNHLMQKGWEQYLFGHSGTVTNSIG